MPCPITPASLSVPAAPKAKLPLRSRCASAGHCDSTPASFSASCPNLSQFGSASVLILHQTVINESCLITWFLFVDIVPLRASSQKLLLKRATAGRRILSTCSLTLFEVLLSAIVLPAAQVWRQSSEGMPSGAAAKASGAINGACCVGVDCLLLDVLFSRHPCSGFLALVCGGCGSFAAGKCLNLRGFSRPIHSLFLTIL